MIDIITPRRRVLSPWTPLLGVAAILLAVGVFGVTQSVKQREAKVDQINRQILAEQQTMRVLDAEWAYLTRPQRLQDLMAMKANDGVMPPAAVMVARVDPAPEETTGTQEATKVAAAAPVVATPAPVAAAPVAVAPAPVAAKVPEVVKPVVLAKAEPKVEAVPVKIAPAKVAAVQPAKKVASVKVATATPVAKTPVKFTTTAKVASNDYVWSPKHNDHRPQVPVMAQTVSYPKYASVKRAGVAHPIVE